MAKSTYFVCVVSCAPYDSHAASTPRAAVVLANPDVSDTVAIWQCEANDGGEARLPSCYSLGKLLVPNTTLEDAWERVGK